MIENGSLSRNKKPKQRGITMITKNEILNLINPENSEKLNKKIERRQNKLNTARFADKTYYGGWGKIRKGMMLSNYDTNGEFARYENEWLALNKQFTYEQKHWFWAAYKMSNFRSKNEPNASVRLLKNAALRVNLAKGVLYGGVAKKPEFCEAVRAAIIKRGKYGKNVANLFHNV